MLRLLGILVLGNLLFGGRHSCCRSRGSFLSGMVLLAALMFGGWMIVAFAFGIIGLIGSLIGGVFSGLSMLLYRFSSVSSVALGIVIGVVMYYMIRRQKVTGSKEQ